MIINVIAVLALLYAMYNALKFAGNRNRMCSRWEDKLGCYVMAALCIVLYFANLVVIVMNSTDVFSLLIALIGAVGGIAGSLLYWANSRTQMSLFVAIPFFLASAYVLISTMTTEFTL